MGIPGPNLLRQALKLIASQQVRYFQDTGRTTSATGRDVTTFAAGVDVPEGSVQAVPLNRYEVMGLDFQKRYVTWFVSLAVVGVGRDRSGDQFEFGGRRYGVVSETPWNLQDGWTAIVGIDIGAAT